MTSRLLRHLDPTHPLILPHESPTHVGAAIPVDAPGVTISPPIDKLGTRDDPRGNGI